MDFSTAHGTSIPVQIDGVDYHLPQFLNSAFKEWVAVRQKAIIDAALAEIGPKKEERARFRLYFRPPPVDVVEIANQLKTPDGVEHVVRWSCEHGKPVVPPDIIARLIESTPAPFLRDLAGLLMGTEVAVDAMERDSQEPGPAKDGESPLTQGGEPSNSPPLTSDDAPTTTAST